MTFGSLFAGIGGMDLGLERAGMQCVWQVEIDPYARRVLEKHWPSVRRWDDVRTFPPEPLADWRCDLICGGFPCQDISYAGKGAGLAGERSGLFYELLRVAGIIRPHYLLLENIAALLARGMGSVLGALASCWNCVEWDCFPAGAFGAPHFRDRVFLLARNSNGQHECSQPADAQFGEEASAGGGGEREDSQKGTPRPGFAVFGTGIVPRPCWEPEPGLDRVDDGVPFGMDRNRCLGNAVVPQVAQWIGERILDHHRQREEA
jgi:DNA (cytosine-5)-methyltransferase 1